jgi:hypothetical protein
MRAYTIIHKGKKTWQKMIFEKEITFSENHTITIYAGDIFFRKKDAKEYLGTFPYPEYLEVIGLTINESDKDNRKKTATKVYSEGDLDRAIDWAIENGRTGKVTSKDIDNFIQSLNHKNKQP